MDMSYSLPPNFPDTTKRPPTVPAALGTKLYPLEAIMLNNNLPVATQMRVSSLKRRRYEAYNFVNRKHPQYEEFREYHCSETNYCSICSEYVSSRRPEMSVVSHIHYSSMSFRRESNHQQSTWAEFFCPTCKIGFHSYKTGVRYPVLITSSTLANWQGLRSRNGYPGDEIHVDQISVPGARIENLEIAFLAEYSSQRYPCDVLIVSGLNDIIRGRLIDNIINDLTTFKEEVLKIRGSSFSVSTIPMAPSITRLEQDTYALHKSNLTEKMIELNDRIIEFNESSEQSMPTTWAPRFHTWGLKSIKIPRMIGPRNRLEAMPAHAVEDWRERRQANQLHLDDKVRLRMGRAVIKYFKSIYCIE